MDKVHFLFKYVDHQIRSKLVLDDEALYSTTDQTTADKITSDILGFVPETATVTDATACAGGNTYSFAQHFAQVYAFEVDAARARMLRHNMKLLGANNVTVRQGDSFSLCTQQYQDLVFLDPPWGGPNYKNHRRIALFMSGRHLADFCKTIADARVTRFIALKAPTNFDEADFLAQTHSYLVMRHKNGRLRKMLFYIFEVTDSMALAP